MAYLERRPAKNGAGPLRGRAGSLCRRSGGRRADELPQRYGDFHPHHAALPARGGGAKRRGPEPGRADRDPVPGRPGLGGRDAHLQNHPGHRQDLRPKRHADPPEHPLHADVRGSVHVRGGEPHRHWLRLLRGHGLRQAHRLHGGLRHGEPALRLGHRPRNRPQHG